MISARTVRSMDPQLALDQVQSMERRCFRERSSTPLQYCADLRLRPCGGTACGTRHLQRNRIFRGAARAGDGNPHCPGIAKIENIGLVFTSAAKLAIAGCAIGLVGAVAASHLLQSFLFGVSPFDPLVLALAAVAVLLLALAASLLPAQRAASIDPMKALRAE